MIIVFYIVLLEFSSDNNFCLLKMSCFGSDNELADGIKKRTYTPNTNHYCYGKR